MSGLSELLSAANKDALSGRAIARLAREQGHSLNHDTAARYLRGDHGTPDESTLVAFAEILGIPLARLRTAAGLPSDVTAPYTPPPEASRLTRRQRRAVDEIIRSMLDPAGRSGVAPASATNAPVDLAAHRAGRVAKTGPAKAAAAPAAKTGTRAAKAAATKSGAAKSTKTSKSPAKSGGARRAARHGRAEPPVD